MQVPMHHQLDLVQLKEQGWLVMLCSIRQEHEQDCIHWAAVQQHLSATVTMMCPDKKSIYARKAASHVSNSMHGLLMLCCSVSGRACRQHLTATS